MRKVVVAEFLSLDGVMEEPAWTIPYWNDEIARFKYDELFASDAHLLGRVTYQGFAAAWPSRTDEQGFADRLKQQPGQAILVAGSATLVNTLIEHDLVDEYHLLIYPVVLGKGKRLFKDETKATLKLAETKTFSSGVVAHIYQPDRK